MSVSSIINRATGKIYDELIPQGGGVALTKGQLITANNQNPPVEVALPVGVNGTILMADSTQDDGLRWAVVPGAIPLAQGQLISADLAGDPTLVPAPILPAQANYVLSADGSAGALGTNLLWKPPTGAGGLIDATLPLIDTAGAGTNTISINFTAGPAGQIPYGNGTALTGALTNTPTPNQVLGVLAGVPAWIDAGASGVITATPPIFEEAGAGGASNLYINYSANIGEIPYGNGTAKTGAFTNVPVAGDILGMAGTPPVPTWINAPANVGTVVYRNSVDNIPLTNIASPLSANSTMIITADRTYQAFAPAQVYNQALITPPAGSQDLLTNSFWFNWTAPADMELTTFTGSFFIASNQTFPDGSQILCSCAMINTTTTAIVVQGTFSAQNDGAQSYNFTGNPVVPGPLVITNGQVFQFQISIDGAIPLGGTYFASNNGTGLVGELSIQANQFTNTPASFVLAPPAKFRTNNDLVGKSSATCASFASQSFVATANAIDWVMVGALNGGVVLVP